MVHTYIYLCRSLKNEGEVVHGHSCILQVFHVSTEASDMHVSIDSVVQRHTLSVDVVHDIAAIHV